MMIKTLNKDEKMFVNLELSDKTRKRIIISESGLYVAINNSSNSNAKEFKKWIISVVLPKMFNTYFNSSGEQSNQLINVSQMAEIIRDEGIKIVCKGSGRNKLFEWLIEYGLCIKQNTYNVPTTYAINFGLMKSTPNTAYNDQSIKTTLITSKGQNYILNRFLNKAA